MENRENNRGEVKIEAPRVRLVAEMPGDEQAREEMKEHKREHRELGSCQEEEGM